ncbi:BtrH N-terminal domain-containing protein (plasmid) [Alkalihalophilus pseudofirmus]|uniref:BtrH N-terminal domain-containing protein n=1 Tax=Alkalihalophilus pseudofirmus TaxID=79885 RepID=UPI00259B96A7|nr:BtrH N-terminal domain-containing protein [Alkalihalophilus pseudofirmus]WEG19159.1 BtrH N-terminal domain-containing protein [Alkalihalophilus pseudofirmus]
MWKKVGYHFKPNSDFVMSPYYLSLQDELKSYGFILNQKEFNDIQSFQEALLKCIEQEIIVGVSVDLYNLPYSVFYQDLHYEHDIEVISYHENTYVICDHYYNYFGEISSEDFMKAIENQAKQGSLRIYYIETYPDHVSQKSESIIQRNIDALEGNISYSNYGEFSYIGIEAINEFKEQLINEFSKRTNLEEQDKLFNTIYPSIKEMSFSRYHFKNYLEKTNKSKKLVMQYHDVSQSWSILFQILLKGNVTRDYNKFLTRVNNSLSTIYQKEASALKYLKEDWAKEISVSRSVLNETY